MLEQLTEDLDDSQDELLAHLLDDASDTGKTHVLQLIRVTLNNLEDHLNAAVNHCSQNHGLIVNKTLPDLTGLIVNLLDRVVFEDEHAAEDPLFGLLVNVSWGCFNNVILEFLNELVHKDG